MLDSLFSTSISDTLNIESTLLTIFAAIILGVVISIVYIKTHKEEMYSKSFVTSLIMLPAIIAIIILLVGNNVARAFSLAGAFSLIRFRSAPGDSKDIAYVFFTLAVGLACGMGFIAYGALFAIILCAVMIILQVTDYGNNNRKIMKLKIVVPEDLNFEGEFDDILNEHTNKYELVKVKTIDFGSLYELSYNVDIKEFKTSKEFIDKIRCKNGNLNVSLSMLESSEINRF